MNYESKPSKYFFYAFRLSIHFFQIFTILYYAFMPDWSNTNFDSLLFLISIIGTVNLIDLSCFFPDSSNFKLKKILLLNFQYNSTP